MANLLLLDGLRRPTNPTGGIAPVGMPFPIRLRDVVDRSLTALDEVEFTGRLQ